MTIVLVHGVPDTAAMWDPLVSALDARGVATSEIVRLKLPGFDAPVPDAFSCTKEEYAAWIVEQLAGFGAPVDLVGHDWGANFTEYVGSGNPDLVRSWAAFDGAIDAGYEWHELARMWQTPDVGEQVMALMVGDALVTGLRDGGHPGAEVAAGFVDDTMKAAILALYRSAVTVGAEWQPTLERNERPALVGWGALDPFAPVEMGRAVASHAGATFVPVEGAGHWPVIERAEECAAALVGFWDEVH